MRKCFQTFDWYRIIILSGDRHYVDSCSLITSAHPRPALDKRRWAGICPGLPQQLGQLESAVICREVWGSSCLKCCPSGRRAWETAPSTFHVLTSSSRPGCQFVRGQSSFGRTSLAMGPVPTWSVSSDLTKRWQREREWMGRNGRWAERRRCRKRSTHSERNKERRQD